MKDLGKAFEQCFKRDWLATFPNTFCLRLPDQQSGYAGTSQNPCDYICYNYPKLFMLELKSHKGNTFPFTCLRQYSKLCLFTNYTGVSTGVILWFRDHDTVIYVPIDQITKMLKDGKKSINIKMLDSNEYKIIKIPSVKKRVFLVSDYSVLMEENI